MIKRLFGKKERVAVIKGTVLAVQNGKIVPLEEVPDPVFAQKMMGDGVAVIPEGGSIYSPVSGTVITTISSGHAYGIRANEGAEVLVHIGLDTVKLNGEGFQSMVKEGQRVQAGELLAEVDLELLREQGYNMITPILITNMNELKNLQITVGEGKAKAKESVIITYEK